MLAAEGQPKVRRLKKTAYVGVTILVVMVLMGLLVPLISPYSPTTSAGEQFEPPGLEHLFGTDSLGRDVFVRTFAAAQLDLALALVGVAIPLLVGTIIGAMLGSTRAVVVSLLWQVVIDAINAFPFIVLLIGVLGIVGTGLQGLLIALIGTGWARYARVARTRALTLRDVEFVQVTEVLGYSRARVLLKHFLPNVYSEALAYGLSDFVLVIITVAGLSYLGLGVRPPTPEWGGMMADGRLFLQRAWWITVFPGLALSLTAIGVSLIAESVVGWAKGEE